MNQPFAKAMDVDVKELLKTSPKRVWKNWLIDPTEPSPVGYVTMTH